MKKPLNFFSIAMMTTLSVASIRNLPAAAFFGSPLIFFFSFGALFFLLPGALVSSELAATWPEQGGLYSWTEKAFGSRWGALSVWFQWIANVVWYPIVLSFFAGTIAYLFNETLAFDRTYLFTVILATYWILTLINIFGVRLSSKISDILGIFGLVIPFFAILFFGIYWILSHQRLEISLAPKNWIPSFDFSLFVPLAGIMLSFCGIEIATIHAPHASSPQKNYPRALLLATLAITAIFICGSLSIAILVPHERLSMISGVMQAFSDFLSIHDCLFALPIFSLFVALGSFAGMSNWILAIASGLSAAAKGGFLPPFLRQENRFGSPYPILLLQGIIVTLFSSFFILMPSLNSSFWILTVISSQLYMIMYLLLFVSAFRLRSLYPSIHRPFMIPGKKGGLYLITGMGCFSSLFAFLIGFLPPKEIEIENIFLYEGIIFFSLLFCSIPPFFIQPKAKFELN